MRISGRNSGALGAPRRSRAARSRDRCRSDDCSNILPLMLGRKPCVRWPPASSDMPSIRWSPSVAAQRLPVRVGQVVDVLGAGLGQRGRLDPLGEHRPERDQVGVDAGVRLDVGVRRAEQLAGVLGGDRLDGVDVLAAGVEAVADGALGVLVAKPVAHGQQHGGAGVVLAGDQLQRRALVGQFLADRAGDRAARPPR